MNEFIEVRLGWPAAAGVFRPDEGEHLSDRIFKITLRTSDPRLREIAALRSEKDLVYGWDIIRRYSSSELDGAHAFVLAITAMFEPEGESCGTEYDWSGACADCGAGRRVAGSLRLDLTRFPRFSRSRGTKEQLGRIAEECGAEYDSRESPVPPPQSHRTSRGSYPDIPPSTRAGVSGISRPLGK